ncbi:MAG: squalene/phytoene synthase family protein [Alphaproteobacteria bacterium]|nr:squalene/phytoene synthase family protein [Alphaproteobacteria bacterium]
MPDGHAFAFAQAHDEERFLSALFAPARVRPHLLSLYAFNAELARIGQATREPLIGTMRLAWWRGTLETIGTGVMRPHPLMPELAKAIGAGRLPLALFDAMIAARHFDVTGETQADWEAFAHHADGSAGNLLRLSARLFGIEADDHPAIRTAAIAGALIGCWRNHRAGIPGAARFLPEPGDAPARAQEQLRLLASQWEGRLRPALPAFLPVSLHRLALMRREVSSWRRLGALAGAVLRGRP